MSDNLFEEYVNSLGDDEDKRTAAGLGLRDVKIELWNGEIVDAWEAEDDLDPEIYQEMLEAIPPQLTNLLTWLRVCTQCGKFFVSGYWRANYCDGCREGSDE